MTTINTVQYRQYAEAVSLSNGLIDLCIPTSIGPRILRFGLVEGDNLFAEYPLPPEQQNPKEFHPYGGHRLWHAPEVPSRTYYPDNRPIQWSKIDGGVQFIQPLEETTGIQKEIDIRLSDDQPSAEITHRLVNRGLWPVEMAPWALTLMALGGTAILPLPPYGPHPEHLLPSASLAIWPYTNLSDPRLDFGSRAILVRQDQQAARPNKLGLRVQEGWSAYARQGTLFIKEFDYIPGACYPDMGSSVEVFTRGDMLELESLAPLQYVPPGSKVEHVERWTVAEDSRAASDINPDEAVELVQSVLDR